MTLIVREILQLIGVSVLAQIQHIIAITAIHCGIALDVLTQQDTVVAAAHIQVVTLTGVAVHNDDIIATAHLEVFIHLQITIDNECVRTAGAVMVHAAIINEIVRARTQIATWCTRSRRHTRRNRRGEREWIRQWRATGGVVFILIRRIAEAAIGINRQATVLCINGDAIG